MKTALIIIDLLACLALVVIVVSQTGKTSGLSGAIGGGSDTFLARNKSKTLDARLSRATKWVAGAFVILTLILNLI